MQKVVVFSDFIDFFIQNSIQTKQEMIENACMHVDVNCKWISIPTAKWTGVISTSVVHSCEQMFKIHIAKGNSCNILGCFASSDSLLLLQLILPLSSVKNSNSHSTWNLVFKLWLLLFFIEQTVTMNEIVDQRSPLLAHKVVFLADVFIDGTMWFHY